jgi:hypothetical protein
MITDNDEFKEFTARSGRPRPTIPAKAAPPPPPAEVPVVNVTVPVPKVVVENHGEPFPTKLVFDIVRDSEGRMKQIVMRKP